MSAIGPTEITIEYVQRGEGVPQGGKTGRLSRREGSLDPRMLVTCANPACRKGGFLLRREIDRAVSERQAEVRVEGRPCAGFVGAIRSERGPADRCPNTLEATVTLTWRPPSSA